VRAVSNSYCDCNTYGYWFGNSFSDTYGNANSNSDDSPECYADGYSYDYPADQTYTAAKVTPESGAATIKR
jgi:hypothetical protein